MNNYLQKFEELLTPLLEMAEDILVGTFTNGLDPVIRTEVFAIRVVGLKDIMDVARLAEEKIEMARTTQDPYTRDAKQAQKPLIKNTETSIMKVVTLAKKISVQPNSYIQMQMNMLRGSGRRENNFKRWINLELQVRHNKGLCYRCDEPFSKMRHCKNKEL